MPAGQALVPAAPLCVGLFWLPPRPAVLLLLCCAGLRCVVILCFFASRNAFPAQQVLAGGERGSEGGRKEGRKEGEDPCSGRALLCLLRAVGPLLDEVHVHVDTARLPHTLLIDPQPVARRSFTLHRCAIHSFQLPRLICPAALCPQDSPLGTHSSFV